jgi:hypothetical protein
MARVLPNLAPDLLDTVPMCRRRQRTVASAVSEGAWAQDILGPLTIPVIMQFLDIHQRVQQVHLLPSVTDRFVWKWCSSGWYSSRSAYLALFLGRASVEGAKQLWKSMAPRKVRFFMWLVLLRRC